MNSEQQNVQFHDLAQVLHNAQLRRSADLGLWLREYLRKRRKIKGRAPTAHPQNRIGSFMALPFTGVTNNQLRLAAWCLATSLVVALGVWTLIGPPEREATGIWLMSRLQ